MSVRTQKPGIKEPAKRNSHSGPAATPVKASEPVSSRWGWAIGIGVGLLAALIAYWPALHGEFLFDDVYMHFASPRAETLPFKAWVIGARPLGNLSYWLNFQM